MKWLQLFYKKWKKVFCSEHIIKPAFGRTYSYGGIFFLKLGAREQSHKTFYNFGQIYKVVEEVVVYSLIS